MIENKINIKLISSIFTISDAPILISSNLQLSELNKFYDLDKKKMYDQYGKDAVDKGPPPSDILTVFVESLAFRIACLIDRSVSLRFAYILFHIFKLR